MLRHLATSLLFAAACSRASDRAAAGDSVGSKVAAAASAAPAGTTAPTAGSAPAPAADSVSMLTIADVPAAALAALRSAQPKFEPWDTVAYSPVHRGLAHRSRDEGLVVARGDFRGTGHDDYVIAGRTNWGPMIVALLAGTGSDSSYEVSVVSEGGPAADSTTKEPPVVIDRAPAEQAKPTDPRFEIRVFVFSQGVEQFVWTPERRRFLLAGEAD